MGFLGSIQSTLGIGINARANLGLNMPDSMMNGILGYIEEETDINVVEAINDLSLYAKLLYCFGATFSFESWGNILSGMAGNLAGTLAQVMGEIMSALMLQVDMAINTVIGTVTNAINAVLSLIDAVVSIIRVLANLPKLLEVGGLEIQKFLLSREACEEVIASILACLLNKFFGDPLEDFKNKMIDKINEYGYTANQALVDEFADINVISAYVQQESFLLTKASYQMEGLYANFGITLDASPVAQENETKQADDVQVDKNGTVKAKGTKTKTTTPPKSRMAEKISKEAAPQPQTGGGDTETITITEQVISTETVVG